MCLRGACACCRLIGTSNPVLASTSEGQASEEGPGGLAFVRWVRWTRSTASSRKEKILAASWPGFSANRRADLRFQALWVARSLLQPSKKTSLVGIPIQNVHSAAAALEP